MRTPAKPAERVRQRRPKGSGPYPHTPLRLAPDLVAAIDKVAAKLGISRSECIRQWIQDGLKRAAKR